MPRGRSKQSSRSETGVGCGAIEGRQVGEDHVVAQFSGPSEPGGEPRTGDNQSTCRRSEGLGDAVESIEFGLADRSAGRFDLPDDQHVPTARRGDASRHEVDLRSLTADANLGGADHIDSTSEKAGLCMEQQPLSRELFEVGTVDAGGDDCLRVVPHSLCLLRAAELQSCTFGSTSNRQVRTIGSFTR